MNESQIGNIVKEVLLRIQMGESPAGKGKLGVFQDMNTAIAEAKRSQKIVHNLSMADRERIISNIRRLTVENAEIMSEMCVQETGMGNVTHKIAKHKLTAEKTPGTEDIITNAWSGDCGLTLIERGPFGVIGAVTPSTNPTETIICNTIGMLAGGNTVAFNPHPGAKNASNFAVDLVNRASLEAGGPANIAVSIESPTNDTGGILFKHPDTPLLVATGGPGVVTTILSCGKRGIGAGAGNPPVMVDDTADLAKAAKDIIDGATFDNNLPCIAEKEIVALTGIADELMYYMVQNGAYMASAAEVQKLCETVFVEKNGRQLLNRKCVGRDARTLLKMIGVEADENIRCILFEGGADHPMIAEELMMPILGLVKVNSIDEGIATSVALEHGNRHSAHIHSKNVETLTRYGKAIDTAIFVKNGPSYNAIGFGGEGFCTFTIASRTGEGLTSAMTFTKSRRCVMSDSLCIR